MDGQQRSRLTPWSVGLSVSAFVVLFLAAVSSIFLGFPDAVLLALTAFSPLAATAGIITGHIACQRIINRARDTEPTVPVTGIVLGYFWWGLVILSFQKTDFPPVIFVLVLLYIEVPRLVLTAKGKGPWFFVALGLVLSLPSILFIVVASHELIATSFIGAAELAFLAGWFPFRRRDDLAKNGRLGVIILYYVLAVATIAIAWVGSRASVEVFPG
jgi:hypothetical protein